MVQNKEKLREVGLEPDKPAGHIRAIWALTLILAFALIIGGGVYFILWYSPWDEISYWHRQGISDETKNWQTYTNSSYKISIKYPRDWQYAEFPTSLATGSFVSVSFYNKDLSAEMEKLKANPATELVYDVALTMLEGDRKVEYSNEESCEKQSDTKINGITAEIYKCRNQMIDKDFFNYVVVNINKTYVLMSDEDNKSNLEKMVGTLSFGAAGSSLVSPSSSISNSPSTSVSSPESASSSPSPSPTPSSS